jgi:hypothetical protein
MMDSRADPIATWAVHQAALEALARSLDALRKAGIEPLVVKGMVLAYQLYSDVAQRPLSDVDLRVRRREYLPAVRALLARGWRIDYTSKQLGAIGFVVGRALVEIECTVGPPGLCGLGIARMTDRARPRRLPNGITVLEPDVVDHAILLAVNAFKDKLVDCPRWSVDDLVAIASHPEFDVDRFLARVSESETKTVVWIVANWLAGQRRSSVWRAIRDRIGSRPPRRAYAWAFQRLVERGPRSAAARVVARVGSDRLFSRGLALGASGIGSMVSWIGARVHATACPA